MDSNILIIALVILVCLSAFFSSTETAFSSVNKIKIKNLANNGDKRAMKVYKIVENYSTFLSTILIGNNIVNITASSLATALFINIFGQEAGVTYSTLIMTVIILIFGEITPKALAKERPESFALLVVPIISFLMMILRPINFIFDVFKSLIVRIFKVEKSDETYSSEEFITIVEEAHSEGDMDDHEADLLTNAIEFNDVDVKDIMVPRVDVVAIAIDTPLDEIGKIYRESGYSRLPVYKDSIDNIIGFLHEKDFYYIYYNKDANKDISKQLKKVIYTTPYIKISSLLRQLQTEKTHFAIVIDEYGGTFGIVTMEDILEELVGEIYDEHDEVEEYYKKIDDKTYLVKGDEDIDDMFKYFDIKVDDDFEFVSVSGWVIDTCDKIPVKGDSFDYKHMHVTVIDADEKKVNVIKVELSDPKIKEEKEDKKQIKDKNEQ